MASFSSSNALEKDVEGTYKNEIDVIGDRAGREGTVVAKLTLRLGSSVKERLKQAAGQSLSDEHYFKLTLRTKTDDGRFSMCRYWCGSWKMDEVGGDSSRGHRLLMKVDRASVAMEKSRDVDDQLQGANVKIKKTLLSHGDLVVLEQNVEHMAGVAAISQANDTSFLCPDLSMLDFVVTVAADFKGAKIGRWPLFFVEAMSTTSFVIAARALDVEPFSQAQAPVALSRHSFFGLIPSIGR
jgi:hypothetical protein